MPAPLSAIDAISPAFNQTKQELFQPFRWGFWLRMALVAAATGGFSGNSGWSGFNHTIPTSHSGSNHFLAVPPIEYLTRFLPWIVLGGVLLFAFGVLMLYVSSVFRFILFDSVLENRCALRESWRRRCSQGTRLFLWWICFSVAALSALAILVGLAVFAAVQSGALHDPRRHVLFLVLGGGCCLMALACWLLAVWVVTLFAKDFLVPVLALEDVGVVEGWGRVLEMLKREKGAYLGYVLMRIVLAVGAAIIFGILSLIVLLVLAIPVGLGGFAAYAMLKSAGMIFTPPGVAIIVLLGGSVLAIIIYVLAFVSTPAVVFFQAYLIHFLGSRYPLLGDRLRLPGAPPLTGSAAAPAG